MKIKAKKSRMFEESERSLQEFLKDEDGFVSRESILKAGAVVVASVGAIGAVSDMLFACTTSTVHSNSITVVYQNNPGGHCSEPEQVLQHSNHSNTHCSY